MPLTIDFRETIRERAQTDAAFRRGLLQEAVELMLAGDVKTGQKIIRNYINATGSAFTSWRSKPIFPRRA